MAMRVLKEDSETEKNLQELEEILDEKDISFNMQKVFGEGRLVIKVKGREFVIYNLGTQEAVHSFPRSFDDDRFFLLPQDEDELVAKEIGNG